VTQIDTAAPRPGPRPLAARWRHDLVFFSIAALIIAADQFTKWLVRSNLEMFETWPADSDGLFRIIRVANSGAAFGILQGQTLFLVVTSSLGLAAILLYYVFPPMEHGLIRIALGMQLGGAIGNMIDRVRFREVTDFIDVGSFPTFNIADASISVSIAAVLIFFLFQGQEDAGAHSPPGAQSPHGAQSPPPQQHDAGSGHVSGD
jgi:signal peptidase II